MTSVGQRYQITILSDADRATAVKWCGEVEEGTRIEFKDKQRRNIQNRRMWAMLGDISKQHKHYGRFYADWQWKSLFLYELGREATFMPSLDGNGFLPVGQSSRDLSVKEMSDLIELMFRFGAENNVEWKDPSILKDNPRDSSAALHPRVPTVDDECAEPSPPQAPALTPSKSEEMA